MNAKFGIMAAVCALIWIAGLADASAQRHFNPDGLDAPRRMCTFERCYGRCVSQGGSQRRGTPGNQLLSDVRPALPEIARAGRTEGPSLALCKALVLVRGKPDLSSWAMKRLRVEVVMAVGPA